MDIRKRSYTHKNNLYRGHRYKYEFWIICLLVSIGLYDPIPIGFYQFRLVDLIFIFSFYYCLQFLNRKIFTRRIRILLSSYFLYVLFMIMLGALLSENRASLRTILGMAITYLTPCIFFVVRESQVNRKMLLWFLGIACSVSLLSQLGLLSMGENNVGGAVNIGNILGIPSRKLQEWDYSFSESTITIWRSLSVGLTIALLLIKTKPSIKFLAVIALILQFAGGGGTRSSLVFLGMVPLLFALWYGNSNFGLKVKRVSLFLLISVLLGSLYLWGPFGGKVAKAHTSDKTTHYERVSEVFLVLSGYWDSSYGSLQTYNARMYVWDKYLQIMTSNPSKLFLGTGLNTIGLLEIKDEHNEVINGGLAHNMILDVWGNTGLFGLTFFLIFLIIIIKDIKKLLKVSSLNQDFKIIGISYSIAVLYFFQYLFFQAVTFDRSFMIVFYLIAGTIRPITNLIIRDLNYKKELRTSLQGSLSLNKIIHLYS